MCSGRVSSNRCHSIFNYRRSMYKSNTVLMNHVYMIRLLQYVFSMYIIDRSSEILLSRKKASIPLHRFSGLKFPSAVVLVLQSFFCFSMLMDSIHVLL